MSDHPHPSTQTTDSAGAPRSTYIDVLRGMLMILVVMGHVDNILFWPGYDLAFDDVLQEVRMPLFFFISGFLAYSSDYTRQLFTNRTYNRVLCQLYPTVIFFIAYCLYTGVPIKSGIKDPHKDGYWFTYVVFVHFYILAVSCLAMSRMKLSIAAKRLVMAAAAMMAILLLYKSGPIAQVVSSSFVCNCLSVIKITTMLPYFILGAFVKSVYPVVKPIIVEKASGGAILAAMLCLGIAGICLTETDSSVTFMSSTAMLTAAVFLSTAFIARRVSSDSLGFIGRQLALAGRNTLQIYLLHLFVLATIRYLLPRSICFTIKADPTLATAVFTLLAIATTYICLAAYAAMRRLHVARRIFPPRNLYRDGRLHIGSHARRHART